MDPTDPIPTGRATPDGHAEEAAIKVVGFHIEGEEATSSETANVLGGRSGYRGGGSPMPVTIPPTFKGQKQQKSTGEAPPTASVVARSVSPKRARIPPSARQESVVSSELTRQMTPRDDGKQSGSGGPVTKDKDVQVNSTPVRQQAVAQSSGAPQNTEKESGEKKSKGGKGKGGSGSGDAQKDAGDKVKTGKKGGKQKEHKDKSGMGSKAGKSGGLLGSSSTSLFDHLQQYKKLSRGEILRRSETWDLHPSIVQLGIQYAEGKKFGGIGRCTAMLEAFKDFLDGYASMDGLFYPREFLSHLNQQIGFLVECRPLNVCMKNSIRFLKVEISKLKSGVGMDGGKAGVRRLIDAYLMEKTNVSHVIAKEACGKIREGDVILTFSPSQAVVSVLLHTWEEKHRNFRVVVVDSRPEFEGRRVLSKLVEIGIPCTYIYINALSYVMKEVTKVFMGASAVLMNGTVVARVGSAGVAMMAKAHSIPVVICAETCKFHERVQLDSFTQNELGNPEKLAVVHGRAGESELKGWENNPKLGLLNLKYDVMPAAYVSMIVTELGMIPTTSVPVILREYSKDKEADVA